MKYARIARAVPFALVLGGFALRLYQLGASSLWYDETVSLLLAQSDLAELTRHTAGDIHPPLYYYLLHFWGRFAGWSEFSAAFLSLLCGVLLIALVYRVAREWLGGKVALAAAFLVVISPYNVWYSQEVRMYTLGAALGLASVYLFLRMLRARSFVSRDLLAYALVTVLGIYTLYYFIFLIGFEYLVIAANLFLRRPTPFRVRNFVVSQVALALLYLPWLPVALRQALDPPVPPWRSMTALPAALSETFSALVLGQSVEPGAVAPLLMFVLLLIALLFIYRTSADAPHSPDAGLPVSGSSGTALFLLAYTFVPFLEIYVLSLWKPLYHVRYIFTYSPAFYMLLALALVSAGRRLAGKSARVRRAAVGLGLAAFALASAYSLHNFWFDPAYAADDLRGAVAHIAENWRPGDVILVNAGYTYPALAYYYPGQVAGRVRLTGYQPVPGDARNGPILLMTGSIGGGPRLGWNDPRSDFYPTTADETRAALDRVFASHPRIWLLRLYDTVTDPDGVIRQYLAGHGRLIEDAGFSGESNARVQGYLTQWPQNLPPAATPLNANLADRVMLLGVESPAPPRAGAFYDATLFWRPLQTLNYNYQLSLQLLNAEGNRVGEQHEEQPLGNALPTSRWRVGEIYPEPVRLHIPADLAPGEYRVIVKLYNLQSGEVLGEALPLATFKVGD